MPTDLPADPLRLSGRTDVRAALLGGKTFRSLSEQALSPGEERFERARLTPGVLPRSGSGDHVRTRAGADGPDAASCWLRSCWA